MGPDPMGVTTPAIFFLGGGGSDWVTYLHGADGHEGVDDLQIGNGRQGGLRFGVLRR